jgi:peptidoglycan/LPS O-acetylase OafA/YrhL
MIWFKAGPTKSLIAIPEATPLSPSRRAPERRADNFRHVRARAGRAIDIGPVRLAGRDDTQKEFLKSMADVQIRDIPLTAKPMPRTEGRFPISGKPEYAYIDCLRGYAVLMVIINHVTYTIPQLPWRAHQLGAFGWHGVQLFFLASCITLLMSSNYERARMGRVSKTDFFIRRFLRIAPMYYLAALLYWVMFPSAQANLTQLLASLAFVNAWHPVTTTTTGDWQVVPGGWSIGVEFTFYFLFPALLSLITTFRRAVLALIVTLAAGMVIGSLMTAPLVARYGAVPTDNFLYFWFFNQAPVFALGAVAYFTIRGVEANPDWKLTHILRQRTRLVLSASLIALLVIAVAPIPFSHHLLFKPALPQFLAASLAFFVFILAMSQSRKSKLINPLIAGLGKVSFSAYLLHFAVIKLVMTDHPGIFHIHDTGWTAIVAFLCSIVIVTALTYLVSAATYTVVEKPMMDWAKRLTRGPDRAARAVS